MPFIRKDSPLPVAPSTIGARPDICPPSRRRTSAVEQTSPQDESGSGKPTETSSEPGRRGTDFDVGYGKPPKHSQFKKGMSGNPRGRPKGAKGMKTMVREVLTEKVLVRTPAGTKKITKMEALFHKKTELALGGNLRALQACSVDYERAVPDEMPSATAVRPQSEPQVVDLDAVDRATLQEYAAFILSRKRDQT